jgi:hypothetical protein
MADVVGYTKNGVDNLLAGMVVDADITADVLTLHANDGSTIPVGSVGGDVPNATESVYGTVTIASAGDVTAGTEDTSAVSPLKLKTVTDALNTAITAASAAPTGAGVVKLYGGSSYAAATGTQVFVGSGTPSGTIANGSVWFDTT